ncbi:hypothetical protein QT972_26990 [Microcoleus sp. herbarium7]
MDWCYLDTSYNGITFLVLSARGICGCITGWAIDRLLRLLAAVDTWYRMLDRQTIIRHS